MTEHVLDSRPPGRGAVLNEWFGRFFPQVSNLDFSTREFEIFPQRTNFFELADTDDEVLEDRTREFPQCTKVFELADATEHCFSCSATMPPRLGLSAQVPRSASERRSVKVDVAM